jgi:hypothetical protein
MAYLAAARFFEQITALFITSAAKKAPSISPKQIEATIKALKKEPDVELAAVRAVLNEMSSQIELILEADVPDDEKKAAAKEDAKVQRILAAARGQKGASAPTQDSERESAEFMAEMRRGSAAAMKRRIANKELLPSKEFQEALDIRRQSISDAVQSGRMFALAGPSGENYYPAFYADADLDRRSVEKVSKALGQLPAASKYFFFTSKSSFLGAETPLEALKKSRVADVLVAAAGFAVR